MTATIYKYPNPAISNSIRIQGTLWPSNRIEGKLDRGARVVFQSRLVDLNQVVQIKPDILITDYAKDLSESTEFAPEELSILRKHGIQLYIQLPAFTANIKRFYALQFFDAQTGEPASDLIGARIGTHDFLVRFWEDTWKQTMTEFIERIGKLRPDGLVIRGLDRGDHEVVDFLKFIIAKARKQGIKKIIAETNSFIDNEHVIRNVDGFSIPGLFFNEFGHRTPLPLRMEKQRAIRRLNTSKQIFVMDSIKDEFLELLHRARSRGLIPILKTEKEDGLLNEEALEPHRAVPISGTAHWSTEVEPLLRGNNRLQLVSRYSLLNTAIIEFQPAPWREILSYQNAYSVIDAEPCSVNLPGNTSVLSTESTSHLLADLRRLGLASLKLPRFKPFLRAFLAPFHSDFYNQWLDTKELKPLLDRFTYPIVLSRGLSTIHASLGSHSVSFGADAHGDHRMILIKAYTNKSVILLGFGDTFATKALSFILNNAGLYESILDDEDVLLITARAGAVSSEEYLPTVQNVLISPLVENLA